MLQLRLYRLYESAAHSAQANRRTPDHQVRRAPAQAYGAGIEPNDGALNRLPNASAHVTSACVLEKGPVLRPSRLRDHVRVYSRYDALGVILAGDRCVRAGLLRSSTEAKKPATGVAPVYSVVLSAGRLPSAFRSPRPSSSLTVGPVRTSEYDCSKAL